MPDLESYIQLGATFLILMVVLVGIYKIAIYFVDKFITLEKENKILEREATNKKDIEFIKTIKDISQNVIEGDDKHELAHDRIGGIIKEGQHNIGGKLDNIHKKVDLLLNK